MFSDKDESASFVEALSRLPEPIVFAHTKYAVAAISSRACHSGGNDTSNRSSSLRGNRMNHRENTSATRTAMGNGIAETAVAENIFQHVLRHWKDEVFQPTKTSTPRRGGYGGGIKTNHDRIVQLLVTATVPLISTLPMVVELIRCFMRYSGVSSQAERVLSRRIRDALDLLLQWANPSMGFTLTARIAGTALVAAVDVLYSSPLPLGPWTDNAVLVAMACAPEWNVRELCGSHRIAAWMHAHVTALLPSNFTPAERLSRWNWLEKCLSTLMPAGDKATLARTLCALLIAVRVELIPQADTVVPRKPSRDREGLLLLLTILAHKEGNDERSSVCVTGGTDESDEDSESCDDFDSSLPKDVDGAIEAFLALQSTSVDFTSASAHGVPVRRLRVVVDELYRFVAEWLCRAVRVTLRNSTVPFGAPSLRSNALPGISLIVSSVGDGDALPLSRLPAHLFSDALRDRQLRGFAGKGLRAAAGRGAVDSAAPQKPLPAKPLPLWPAETKSPPASAWLADLMLAGAVRSADVSAAQWRARVAGRLRSSIALSDPRQRPFAQIEECASRGAVLCVRHAVRTVRYRLSAWDSFPALAGPAPRSQARSRRELSAFVDPIVLQRSGRELSAFVDPIVLQRSGVSLRQPLSPAESEHEAQLRVCYAHLLRRAAAVLDGTERTVFGLHLIPPLSAPREGLCHAVGLSLVSQFMPSPPAARSGATLSLTEFCKRYGPLLRDKATVRDMCQRYDAHEITEAEFVSRMSMALQLPQKGLCVAGDVIYLTAEAVASLAERAAAVAVVKEDHLVETADNEKETEDTDDEPNIATVVSSAIPREAQGIHRLKRAELGRKKKEESTFHVFELQTVRDADPLQFEEWCHMIDTMLAHPTQTENCSDTVLPN